MNKLIFTSLSRSADAWPDKRALACGDVSYTFSQFETLANQVANTVDAFGARRGDRIGIALDKSAEYVCIQFGILKSGGCYVPIDSLFPATRMFQIIDDCGVEILFTSSSICQAMLESPDRPASLKHIVVVEPAAPSLAATHAVAVHPWSEVEAQAKTHTARVPPIDADLAYVMYTSGSTGKPKGVMVTHGNIVTFMDWCDAKLGITKDDRILNTAPFTFDISGLDTFNGVRTGASVHVVKDQKMISSVLTCIEKEKITFVSTVPTVLGAIVNRPQLFKRHDLTSVNTWISGAAACPAVFMKKLDEFLPGRRLMNIYGPTEATIYCMYFEIDAKKLELDKPLSIGIPFENTEAFVVDAEGREAPPNETGELVLRGTQIAAGYFRNPEKTAAAFKTFPLLPHLNERCYYTGDIARKDEAGNFFFLGRKDDMIKSRGYRIELNEIDIALSLLEGSIAEHTAVAVPDPDVENLIYAAIVLKEGATLTADALRAHCLTRIPEYMIPEKFLFLKELPKTTSGKISRKDVVLKIQNEKL